MNPKFLLLCMAVLLGGCCSPHNIFNVSTRVTAKSLTTNQYPYYSGQVFLTQMRLTNEISAEPLATLEAGTATTQSPHNTLLLLANRARQLGANAVCNIKVWKQMSGFSPQAPQASGTAVRLSNTNALVGLSGAWY